MYGTGEWLKSQPHRPGIGPAHSVPHHASRLPDGSGDATRATPWPFLNNGHSGMRTASARTLKSQNRPESDRAYISPGVAGSSIRRWRSARTACTPTGHAPSKQKVESESFPKKEIPITPSSPTRPAHWPSPGCWALEKSRHQSVIADVQPGFFR